MNTDISANNRAGREVEDEARTFKKPFQTIGRPEVTENLNDQYVRDPPHVSSFMVSQWRLRLIASAERAI